MPIEDANRWNLRYQSSADTASHLPSSLLEKYAGLLPSSGLALDIAMGLGDNSSFLLSRGLRVIGVDISQVAVDRAKKKNPMLMAIVADLTHFAIPPNKFDVILDFLYLQRDMWASIQEGLKLGGLLFIECLTEATLSILPEIDPNFLLKPDELLDAFIRTKASNNLEIFYYFEGWSSSSGPHRRAIAQLVARRVA
jgi:tellurite methyltransferase